MRCSFIGHRDTDIMLEKSIEKEIKKMIELGITEFYSGGMGNFDQMCENAVKNNGGNLIFIPYSKKQVKKSDEFWYDKIICPLGDKSYSKYDIPTRNRWLVEHCDIFICYVYKNGGAKSTLKYAIEKNKYIINLY